MHLSLTKHARREEYTAMASTTSPSILVAAAVVACFSLNNKMVFSFFIFESKLERAFFSTSRSYLRSCQLLDRFHALFDQRRRRRILSLVGHISMSACTIFCEKLKVQNVHEHSCNIDRRHTSDRRRSTAPPLRANAN